MANIFHICKLIQFVISSFAIIDEIRSESGFSIMAKILRICYSIFHIFVMAIFTICKNEKSQNKKHLFKNENFCYLTAYYFPYKYETLLKHIGFFCHNRKIWFSIGILRAMKQLQTSLLAVVIKLNDGSSVNSGMCLKCQGSIKVTKVIKF